MAPRRLKIGPRWAQDWPKMAPRLAISGRKTDFGAQDGHKSADDWLQAGSKTPSDRPQSPKRLKIGPRWPQDWPKMAPRLTISVRKTDFEAKIGPSMDRPGGMREAIKL